MYCRSDNYMVEWDKRLDWIAESDEHIAARLQFKVYDEIAPILGLPQNDPVECLTWANIGVECARGMRQLCDRPDWNEVVEAELAAH